MPTGYTADLTEQTSFEEFAMSCARAFGACVMMRDEPQDAPILDEFQPSEYHKDRIAECKKAIAGLAKMTTAKAKREIEQEQAKINSARQRIERESKRLRRVYNRMLDLVKSWEPPTADHFGMKKFMIEQLTESMDFDCTSGDSFERVYPRVTTNPAKWIAAKKAKLQHDLAYHEQEWRNELERTRGRNAWIRALRESLASTKAAV